ncbi:MAG: tRNA lysidine(34) synthetase TilS, partial [Verrucomicrobiae bacterium]|nr:tRNA lysidine(34) synthetase TilS [Verrucomicrobiae bacterium]
MPTRTSSVLEAASDLEDRVRAVISQHGLIPRAAAVVVAVSGGLDSMVLLHVLAKLAPAQEWRIFVAHFNHLLRGKESELDEGLVASRARELGLPFERGQGDVRGHAKANGISIEMAARELRYRFLAEVARRNSARFIALGHHADDQVETVILRLFRGSGGEGLGGMRLSSPLWVDSSICLVRLLLHLSRKIIREYARNQRISYRDDTTNESIDIERNWVRHKLLPLLERRVHPTVRDLVLRTAELIG